MMCRIYIKTIVTFLLVAATVSLSASDSLGFRRYTLPAVRVYGTIPQETISTVSTIYIENDQSKINTNLKELLEGAGGISITTGTKDESNLKIRGFRKNEVKILVDGRPLNPGYFGNIDLQNLPLSEYSEVQILKGPVSSIYGGNSLGGVINLITREPSYKKWLKLGLTAKRNNNNQVELSLAHSFDDFNFWIYSSRINSDGFVLPKDFKPTVSENGDVRNNDSKTQYNFQTKASFTIFDFHTIGFTAGLTTIDKKLIPTSIYESTDYRMYKDWYRFQTTFMGEFNLSDYIKLNSIVFMDGGGDTYLQYNDPLYEVISVDSELKSNTIGADIKLDYEMNENIEVKGGYSLIYLYSIRKDNGNYLNWTPHHISLQNFNFQTKYNPTHAIDITGSIGAYLSDGDMRSEAIGYIEPALGIYYTTQDNTVFSVATGINTAFPTMRQLFSAERGNPNLKPQSGLKTECSVTRPFIYDYLSGSWSICGYYNAVRNLIDVINDKYENVYEVDSYGYEIELNIRPVYWLKVDLSYNYLDFSKESDYILTESPKNSADIQTELSLPGNVKLMLTSSYKDNRKSLDYGNTYHILPYYWVHSAYVARDFGSFKIKCGIDNIEDAYFEEEYGYPAAGRNFAIKLEAEI